MPDFPEHCHEQEHDHEHDHAYLHAHGIAHSHGHVHENQKAVINRLSRAIGHLEKVKRMVEEGHDCSEVLIQLAAVRSALDNTGKVILKDHMRHCMVDAVAAGDTEAIDDLCPISLSLRTSPLYWCGNPHPYKMLVNRHLGENGFPRQ